MSALGSLLPWKWGAKNHAIKKDDPVHFSISTLEDEFNRVLENVFSAFAKTSALEPETSAARGFSLETGLFKPKVDVSENSECLFISAELPGVDVKNIDVSVTSGGITIAGEKSEEKVEDKSGFYRMERHYGSFQRYIAFPCAVDVDKAEAKFKKGILSINVPKKNTPNVTREKISVNAK
jgi:HSP20 family protein